MLRSCLMQEGKMCLPHLKIRKLLKDAAEHSKHNLRGIQYL